MKVYIFISLSIFGMGGGQVYLFRKKNWLENHGYKVFIFSALQARNVEKELFVKNLKDMLPFVCKELNEYPSCLRERDRKNCLEKIISIVEFGNQNVEYFIESDNIATAQWGELVAERIGAKHFSYFLQENIEETFCKDSLDFLMFKNSRKELAGITRTSFEKLFAKYAVKNTTPVHLLAYGCDDCLIDCDYSWLKSQMEENTYRIASIGRINKLYVKPMTEQLVLFVKQHQEMNFEIIYIGGGEVSELDRNDEVRYIRNCFSEVKNVHLIITGSIFPIPEKFILDCNLFIGSAAGAGIPYRKNVQTIALDGHDGKPIGVLGYTVFAPDFLYRPKGIEIIELNDLLEKVICTDYLTKYKYVPYVNELSDYDAQYFSHIEAFNNTQEGKKYYRVDEIKYKSLNDAFERKMFLKKILLKMLGVDFYYFCKSRIKRI